MDIRSLVLGLGVFCATFLVGWWFNIGAVFYSTPRLAAAASEVPATSGQGQAQGQSPQRFVVHVPASAAASQGAPPNAPSAKSPQVKHSQEPKAKVSSSNSSSPKPAIRVRRR